MNRVISIIPVLQVTALGDHNVSQSGFVSLFSVANCVSRLLAGSVSMPNRFAKQHNTPAVCSAQCQLPLSTLQAPFRQCHVILLDVHVGMAELAAARAPASLPAQLHPGPPDEGIREAAGGRHCRILRVLMRCPVLHCSFIPDRLMKVYATPRTVSIVFLCALSAGAAVLNGFADVQLLNLSSFLSGFAFGGMQARTWMGTQGRRV